MGTFHMILVQILTLLLTVLNYAAAAAAPPPPPYPVAKPNCRSTCGNLTIPYPFGTTPGCYLENEYDSFLITCNDTAFDPPQPFLSKSTIEVLDITLDGAIHVSASVARACFNSSGAVLEEFTKLSGLKLSKFPVNSTRNKFTAVGCATLATIAGSRVQDYTTGCVSLCDGIDSVVNGSCSGIGCCQSSIPKGARDFSIGLQSLIKDKNATVLDSIPCSYGFVAEEGVYNFSSSDFNGLLFNKSSYPVMLDWAVGNETCQEAKRSLSSYGCVAPDSTCTESGYGEGSGYRCNCPSGFEGNPYLVNGCIDIDECKRSNPCHNPANCKNRNGYAECSCPKGYEVDGRQGCEKKGRGSTAISIALGISMSLLVLVVGGSWIAWLLRKRKHMQQREKFFQQNGGFMLREQLSKHGSTEAAKIFSAEDLEKATNNYDESRVIGRGGFGTVYRGVISPNNKVVAIKKSKVTDQSQIEQFINEVIILSGINHINVVKLLGCCLETEVPLLVYEFITNGTLSEHLHDQEFGSSLSWDTRLRIAAETAEAIAYLHSAASPPIIHRDIKSTNILMDENYKAKVSDFGASKLVPADQTQLTTLVQGTFGYLDPEYFHSSQLTEKSDVYSFGVLLAELLTGEKALSFDRPEKDRNLATYFVSSVKTGHRMLDIVDKRLVKDGKIEQIQEVAILTARCLRVKGEERPSMKEVAMELQGLNMVVEHPWVDKDSTTDHKESEYLLNQKLPSQAYRFAIDGSSTSYSSTAGFDSMRDQMTGKLQFR